jgi:putative transposase
MSPVVSAFLAFLAAYFRSRRSLQLEILALRHQLAVYQCSVPRPCIQPTDRLFWSWLARAWSGWEDVLVFVQPRTVVAWPQKRFREHWRRLSQHDKPGRPVIAQDLRDLIRTMSQANPTWGSPRMIGELRKLGIDVAKSTVEKYRVRPRTPPSPTWKAFLHNHVRDFVSMDFFVVPTVTYKVLFVLVILAHARRRVWYVHVTEYPTEQWTVQQIVEAVP